MKRGVRMGLKGLLLGMLLAAVPWSPGARAETFYLKCEIDRTWDERTDQVELTTGSTVFTVTVEGEIITNIKVASGCVRRTGKLNQSETSIEISCDHFADGFTQTFFIDRVDGSYQEFFTGPSGKSLVHFGTCERANRKF